VLLELLGQKLALIHVCHIRSSGCVIAVDPRDARDVTKEKQPKEPTMASSSHSPSTGDLLDGTLAAAAGVGILLMTLFPLAIPLLALTAIALIPLLVPLLLVPLAGGLVAAPVLLLRRLFRRAAPSPGDRRNNMATTAVSEGAGGGSM